MVADEARGAGQGDRAARPKRRIHAGIRRGTGTDRPRGSGHGDFVFPLWAVKLNRLEESVQRGVTPIDAVFLGQLLEPAKVGFRDAAGGFLVGRVAVVN